MHIQGILCWWIPGVNFPKRGNPGLIYLQLSHWIEPQKLQKWQGPNPVGQQAKYMSPSEVEQLCQDTTPQS